LISIASIRAIPGHLLHASKLNNCRRGCGAFATLFSLLVNVCRPYLRVNGWHTAGLTGISVHHLLHLFDTPGSLAATVSSFLAQGYQAGGNLLVVAKPANRAGILGALRHAGCCPDKAAAQQRIVSLDARDTLMRISRNGSIDGRLFDSVVGTLVGDLSATRRLWVYGEVVELLAEEEDFMGAIRLEEMWNHLAERHRFSLMCGYSSAHFTAPAARPALRGICATHTKSAATTDDALGQWLLTAGDSFPNYA
jgi:hypothetical protein